MKSKPKTPDEGPRIEMLPIAEVKARECNPRKHPPKQIESLAKSIREFGFTAPVLIEADGTLIAGHGRVEAARKAGLEKIPCLRVAHLSPEQVRAYVIADNRLGLDATWDEDVLGAELKALSLGGFNIELTGFKVDELNEILGGLNGDETKYSQKIEAPVYTPKGEKPNVNDLVDATRHAKLIQDIASANLPTEVSDFLKAAASRHLVFNYEKIAEFYCHADKQTQLLMEDSALVIIDFQKAMQLGYAQVKEELLQAMESEQGGDW